MKEYFIDQSIQKWDQNQLFRLDMHEWSVSLADLKKGIDSNLESASESAVWHPDSKTEVSYMRIQTNKCDIIFRVIDNIADDVVFISSAQHQDWLSNSVKGLINQEKTINNDITMESYFYMVNITNNDLSLSKEDLPKIDLQLELNYAKEINQAYPDLVRSLIDTNPGFYVLYGDTGTGKKHFIKSLIHAVGYDKTIIYLPGYLLADLGSPEFISFLSSQRQSILIVEDAEDALMYRKDVVSNGIVNNLINLTMGLLANELGIKVLVSVNCSVNELDKMLLRPGTITWQQEFKKLPSIMASKLSKHLDINKEWKIDASLAEIYANDVDKSFANTKKKPKRVGFKSDDKD